MGYLNTDSGAGNFFDKLTAQLDAQRQANAMVAAYDGKPAPQGFLGRLLSGITGGQPSPDPASFAAPVSAPAPATGVTPMAAPHPMAFAGAPAPAPVQAPSAPAGFSPLPSGPLATFAASQGVPGSASLNAQRALAFYQSRGLSPLAASALVGGFTRESSPDLNTIATNRGDGSDGSNSIGIGQWNAGRARALHAFAASNGLNPADLDTQLQFSWAELNGPERATLNALMQAQNPGQATAAAIGYERPAGWTAQNPYGAKDFGKRLGATVALSGGMGAGVPAMRGASTYGAMPQGAFSDQGTLPTFAASGMGMGLSPATPFAAAPPLGPGARPSTGLHDRVPPIGAPGNAGIKPAGDVARSSTGQTVQTDASGNAIDPATGRPTSLNYDASTGTIAAAPASRAIAAATGSAGGTAPGTALALTGAAPYAQQPNPQAAPIQATPTQYVPPNAPDTHAMIRQLLSNPDTAAFGSELWKAMLTKTPAGFDSVTTQDGRVFAFNKGTGQLVQVAAGSAPKPDFTFNEVNGRLLAGDKSTGRAIDATPAGIPSGYRPMTAQERTAYGVQDGQAAFVGPDGKPAGLGSGRTEVNVDTKAEGAEAQARGTALAKRFNDIAEDGDKASDDAIMYDRFGDLLNTVQTGGRTAALEKVRQMTGIALDPNTDNVQALNAAIQYLAPRLRVPGSGAQSDRELGNFLSSIPSLAGTPGGNARIMDTLRGFTAYRQARAQVAQDYQLGNIDAQEAQRRVNALPGPFARQTGQGGTPPAPATSATPQGAPVQVRSAEDYARLPSGTLFTDPNGAVRRKK